MADRVSWETILVGVPDGIDVLDFSGIRCMDESFLADYMSSQYRAKDPSNAIATTFITTLLENYPLYQRPHSTG